MHIGPVGLGGAHDAAFPSSSLMTLMLLVPDCHLGSKALKDSSLLKNADSLVARTPVAE